MWLNMFKLHEILVTQRTFNFQGFKPLHDLAEMQSGTGTEGTVRGGNSEVSHSFAVASLARRASATMSELMDDAVLSVGNSATDSIAMHSNA